jgi:two-component system, OmpR family, sensor histidine kinase KdpD
MVASTRRPLFLAAIKTTVRRAVFGTLGIALITACCWALHASFTVASLLFLVVVLLQSLNGSFASSVLVSLEAVSCLEYFFVEPRVSFAIANGEDVVALAVFLTASLIVTRLVSRVTSEAELARLQEQRLARLYRLAQQLLAMEPQPEIGTRFLERFRSVFGMIAVCIMDGDTAQLHFAGVSRGDLAEKTRQAYLAGEDATDPVNEITVRRLLVAGKITGCMGFEGLEDAEVISDPLAALAAALLERARALRVASDAAAAAQAEEYRGAILDALAHEFKTPLATILAAAGGVREAGPLLPPQVEMMETVESEAARLGNLTSRLLRMARVEREEVNPRMETLELIPLLERLTDQFARRSPDRRIVLLKPPGSPEVKADQELLRLAVTQLLENACKYSQPGSTVTVQLQDREDKMEICVSNTGGSIPSREQHRIFDRFYRGSTTRLTPGSGLGLYVARKIALAHGGALDFTPRKPGDEDVSFRLTIPNLKGTQDHVVTVA